jgi:hypothetical protein
MNPKTNKGASIINGIKIRVKKIAVKISNKALNISPINLHIFIHPFSLMSSLYNI